MTSAVVVGVAQLDQRSDRGQEVEEGRAGHHQGTKRSKTWSVRQLLPACCSCHRCPWIQFVLFLVVLLIIAVNGHHVTCRFSVELCIPLSSYVLRYSRDGRPDAWAKTRPAAKGDCPPLSLDMNQIFTEHPLRGTPVASVSPRWAILLTTQASGSTWFNRELSFNPRIDMGGERMLNFSRACRRPQIVKGLSFSGDKDACSWESWRKQAEASFKDVAMGNYDRGWPAVVGFRIHYDHILGEHRDKFAEWIYCQRIVILHMYREAVIESFWSLQARVVDTVTSTGFRFVGESTDAKFKDTLKSNNLRLRLDPEEASAFVRDIELNRRNYRQLLRQSPNGPIAYFEVTYEELTGQFANMFRAAVMNFLGANECGGTATAEASLKKLHPGGCRAKIENWGDVARALEGTHTLIACEAQVAGRAIDPAAGSGVFKHR